MNSSRGKDNHGEIRKKKKKLARINKSTLIKMTKLKLVYLLNLINAKQ